MRFNIFIWDIKFKIEFIIILGDEMENAIIKKVKEVKYYYVIFDCTPDVSHQEQMSLI